MTVITTGVRVGAAKEGSSDAASDAVINADVLLIDDVAARIGRHDGSITKQVQHVSGTYSQ